MIVLTKLTAERLHSQFPGHRQVEAGLSQQWQQGWSKERRSWPRRTRAASFDQRDQERG